MNVFLSKKALSTARERIVSMSSMSEDDAAVELRKLLAGGTRMDDGELETDIIGTVAIVLPDPARAMNGDRVCVLLKQDLYSTDKDDFAAVVVKPYRSCRRRPEDIRINSMPKLVMPDVAKSRPPHPRPPVREAPVVVDPKPEPVTEPEAAAAPVPGVHQRVESSGVSRASAQLRDELRRRKMKQVDFAELMDSSPNTISCWMLGTRYPTVLQALRIEDLLGIAPRAWGQSL